MPIYEVQDTTTGKTIKFEWSGPGDPTEADMGEVFAAALEVPEQRVGEIRSQPPVWKTLTSRTARPVLEFGGLTGGGIAGAGAGLLGAVGGAGLGYSAGGQAADLLDESLGLRQPVGVGERFLEAGKDVVAGAAMEAGGQALPALAATPAAQAVIRPVGRALRATGRGAAGIHGKLTGVGGTGSTEAVASGLRGGEDAFAKALRGKITGEEVVANANQALNKVKHARGVAYREQLAGLGDDVVSSAPVKEHLEGLLKQYNITRGPKGKLDTSRSAMWKKGDKDVKEVVKIIDDWGSRPGDDTAIGLDTLKRQLDDFYSKSGKARSFVASARAKVKDTIIEAVPRYAEMTKGYAEATALIKDIEAGLLMRKQGMTGRIVPDQTLRRLVSAMKDNFALRKELVAELGGAADSDILQQVAGHAMSPLTPRGIGGTGLALLGHASLVAIVNPKFWPTLVASSPRVSGEFLRFMGKAAGLGRGTGPTVTRAIFYLNRLRTRGRTEHITNPDAETGRR